MFKNENLIAKFLYIGAPFVSLFLITDIVTDPVNAPKFFILGGVAFGVLGILASGGLQFLWKRNKFPILVSVIFIISSFFSVILSDLPLTQNLYGVYGRNTGFFTYFFLTLIFLGSLLLLQTKNFVYLIYSLFFAGLVNAIYCGWVIAFGDFIGWYNPYKNVLGLFGNPNFVGSFLGIFLSTFVAYFWRDMNKLKVVLPSLFIVGLTVLAIKESHAIQGIVVSISGLAIVGFFIIRSKFSGKMILSFYTLVVFGVGLLALAGALQRGPLTSLIYKTSVSLRGAYWDAGVEMGLNNPLFGVGMDGYGDWYRRARSEYAATVLPGPSTVTNAAHNVFIDIFSYGGFPLLISYLTLLIFTFLSALRYFRTHKNYDPIFVALVTAWIGYHLQALISINQIGLALWGWLLTGALIAYTGGHRKEVGNENQKIKFSRTTRTVVTPNLIASLMVPIGLFVAYPPLSSDVRWKTAIDSKSLDQVQGALIPSHLNPSDSNKYMKAVELLVASNFKDLAIQYALEAKDFNPDSFDAWRAVYLLNPDEAARVFAFKNMKRLDPNNPEVTK